MQPNTAIRRKFCYEIHGIFGYTVNFWANIRSNCFHNFPTSSLLHSSKSRHESDRNSRWPNSNSSLPNSIYPFKNLTDETWIWIWPPRISVGFMPGFAGVEERGSWEIVETVGPDICSEIHSISKNTVNFVAEFSANGCIWLHIRLSQYFN